MNFRKIVESGILLLMLSGLSLSAAAQTCADAAPGMTAWYRAENSAGDSAFNNPGTLQNGGGFVPGLAGRAFDLDGTDDFVSVPGSPTLNAGTESGLTVEGWIRPVSIAAQRPIVEWNSGAAAGVHIWHSVTYAGGVAGNLFANLVDTSGGDHLIQSPAVLTADVFQHFAVTYDKTTGTARIFLNGTEVANAVLGVFTPQTQPAYNLYLGTRPASGLFFNGALDEITIYGAALDQPAIQSIVTAGSAGKCPKYSVPSPAGLVASWPADGGALDARSRNDGTLQNGAAFRIGKAGRAFVFDGVDDQITVPDSPDLNFAANEPFSIEFWAYRTSTNGLQHLLGKRNNCDGSPIDYQFVYISNQLYFGAGVGNEVASGQDLPLDTWTHVAGTYDGADFRIYLNGVPVGTAPGSLGTTSAPLIIGGSGSCSKFGGSIDEPAVYDRALSSTEIQSIYDASFAGKSKPTATNAPAGLVGFWTGDGNAGDPVSGRSGTPFNGAGYLPGKVGQSFVFDGGDDFVDVPDSAALEVSGQLTLEAWIKPADIFHYRQIISKFGSDGNWAYQFGLAPNGALRFDYSQSGSYPYEAFTSPAFVIADNVWNHVAVTFNGGAAVMYVNGVAVGNAALASTSIFNGGNTDLNIGRDPAGLQYFAGQIDEASLYDRALTPTEIQSIFNAGTAGKLRPTATINTDNFVSLWRAEGNADDFTAANNGTPQNGTTFSGGKFGRAFSFDGIDDTVQVNDSASLDLTGNFTLLAWINPASLQSGPARGGIISKVGGGGGNNGYQFGMSNNNTELYCQFNAPGEAWPTNQLIAALGSAIPVGSWTSVACTYDHANLTLYVNGVAVGTTAVGPKSVIDSASGLRIGGDDNGNVLFHGLIDEPAVYGRALSPSEIQAVYRSGNGVSSILRDATVTFPNVATAGLTQQIPLDLSSLPALPAGSTPTGLAYDIATTAVYAGSPTVCFKLPFVANSVDFNNLRILHLEAGAWRNRTDLASLDFASRTVCTAGLNSLSPFAIVNGFAPTAAGVTIGGRARTAEGTGIPGVGVSITDLRTGATRAARTGSFGYYAFDGLEAGAAYVLSAASKKYAFTSSTRVLNPTDSVTDEDFIADRPAESKPRPLRGPLKK